MLRHWAAAYDHLANILPIQADFDMTIEKEPKVDRATRRKRVLIELLDPLPDARPLDMDHVRTLAESIRDHGLLQPIAVVEHHSRYLIGIGNHRAAAHQFLGETDIEADIWPADTTREEILLRSIHENHVRVDESFETTLSRIHTLMAAHGVGFREAAKRGKFRKSHLSKIETVLKRIKPKALACLQEHKLGVSIAYAIARGSDDEDTQIEWIKQNAAGKMNRSAIEKASKAKPCRMKTVTLSTTIDDVAFTVTLPKEFDYERLKDRIRGLSSKVGLQAKRNTPIDLLPRFLDAEESA